MTPGRLCAPESFRLPLCQLCQHWRLLRLGSGLDDQIESHSLRQTPHRRETGPPRLAVTKIGNRLVRKTGFLCQLIPSPFVLRSLLVNQIDEPMQFSKVHTLRRAEITRLLSFPFFIRKPHHSKMRRLPHLRRRSVSSVLLVVCQSNHLLKGSRTPNQPHSSKPNLTLQPTHKTFCHKIWN